MQHLTFIQQFIFRHCFVARVVCPVLVLGLGGFPAAAQTPPAARALTVVSASPTGEVESLQQANEIRVVFSEPMVTLGRIPAVVRPPYFKISPAVAGSFRWSGTTILIFTPDPKRPLPFATNFEVTIDRSAAALSGHTLAQPHRFVFTTPTMKLVRTDYYRRGGRADAPYVVILRFNQPVGAADIAPHLQAAFVPHEWSPPAFGADLAQRLAAIDPTALARFSAKVAAVSAVAAASAPVILRPTSDWDRKRFPHAREQVVFETVTRVPPESQVKLSLGQGVRSRTGAAVPGAVQEFTLEAERAFFVNGFRCAAECDPDDYNPIQLRGDVAAASFSKALAVREVTAGAGKEVPRSAERRQPRELIGDQLEYLTLEDAGFATQPPATTYVATLDAALTAADGQTLGYTWLGVVENWHRTAFTSFGDGHGVWEAGGGTVLPFYARNVFGVKQWAGAVAPGALMPTIRTLTPRFAQPPDTAPIDRKLGVTTDRIQSHGLDVAKALGTRGTGLVWTAVENGDALARARRSLQPIRASIVQVTNLGVTVKDSPQNTLVFVTRLDTAAPVAGARVSIVNKDNSLQWSGSTGADGVARGPGIPRVERDAAEDEDDEWQRPTFLVLAEKDGDIAYVGSNWNEGIEPWDFGLSFNRDQAEPMLRGALFSDRGVYRPGEEVHFKAILRQNTADGVRLLRTGTLVYVTLRDGQYRLVEEKTVAVNAWSSAEWTTTLPAQGALGNYSARAVLATDKPSAAAPEDARSGDDPSPELDDNVADEKAVRGTFLVAAYRRPDFRVDVTLAGPSALAGDPLAGVVTARYLFGAAMGARPVAWSFTRTPLSVAPAAVYERFSEERWQFVGERESSTSANPDREVGRDEARLSRAGDLELSLTPQADAGVPYIYTLEGEVEDVSRQKIANRTSLLVHPAPWYVGVRRPSYFTAQQSGLRTEIVAVTPAGQAVPGVTVDVTLTQVQWTSVRRSEGNGFYTWDTERKELPAGSWSVTTAAEPVALDAPLPSGGYFVLEAIARDGVKRHAVTQTSFYALGDGYTAWARFDHNRIDLVPEKRTYKPGDTARIMIQSPWEQATALVTTEREGIRSHRQFALTSTQQSIAVPITEEDIPNVFVSVLLLKGRSQSTGADKSADPAASRAFGGEGPNVLEDPSDPGKPAFRLGYVELAVEDASKRLKVAVRADKTEYRPANAATVQIQVKDANERGAPSEVTLWAVDYGVLSLTAYRTPDVLGSVYVDKALQVMNADNRQRIISRRVLTPKGATEGGGGGVDGGDVRRDFRVLAFWLGSVTTDEFGNGAVTVKLPESLTTYRIMAVAADRSSRFGSGDTEVRVNKPLTMKPAFPRFLALGDKAYFGAVVTSQLTAAGTATVSISSLDPQILEFPSNAEQSLPLGGGGSPGSSIEARFDAVGKRVGRARVHMTVTMNGESDRFEDVIPVELLVSPQTVAAHGEASAASPTALEALDIPGSVLPDVGGLHLEMSSTAMVGLGEGARYLVEYPYGCAEQRGSRTLALVLASDLGDAFALPGIDTKTMRPSAQQQLQELGRFQCPDGGFSYWAGDCVFASPYLTAYLLHVFKTAADHKFAVDRGMRERAYAYLERRLAGPAPTNEGWWPAYTAWQAYAVKVLVEGGRNQDSHLTRLYGYRDRMPVFALAFLHDALVARGAAADATARIAELRRRMANSILPEAGSAHVEELSDPYLLWFWSSNVRSTAIVLNSLAKASDGDAPVRQMVRWLMAARRDGRWGNTQENALAMAALIAYYRKYESEPPDFRATIALGAEAVARQEFRGRSTTAATADVPMSKVLAHGAGATPLTFAREGTGTLFYTARLRYAADERLQEGLDNGIRIERSYAPYAETGTRAAATSYKAGDLVRVTLTFDLTKERRFVAVTDPLPAGFEAVESWFATTAAGLAQEQAQHAGDADDWRSPWQRGGFDRIERFDNRIELFATRLSEGRHAFTYIARATTAGTFQTAPARAEEMYEPEVFGRTPSAVIEVRR